MTNIEEAQFNIGVRTDRTGRDETRASQKSYYITPGRPPPLVRQSTHPVDDIVESHCSAVGPGSGRLQPAVQQLQLTGWHTGRRRGGAARPQAPLHRRQRGEKRLSRDTRVTEVSMWAERGERTWRRRVYVQSGRESHAVWFS